jgi:hypothetical protein
MCAGILTFSLSFSSFFPPGTYFILLFLDLDNIESPGFSSDKVYFLSCFISQDGRGGFQQLGIGTLGTKGWMTRGKDFCLVGIYLVRFVYERYHVLRVYVWFSTGASGVPASASGCPVLNCIQ